MDEKHRLNNIIHGAVSHVDDEQHLLRYADTHNPSSFSLTGTGIKLTMSQNDQLIPHMQGMARDGNKVSQILRFLVIDQGIEEQLLLMELFRDAFKTPFGSVTAIGAWWYEGERELDDNAINSYIGYVIDDFLTLEQP